VNFVEHELVKADTIERRDYQLNIAFSCVKRSTLIVLPTGLGKTVIALIVIADVLKNKGPKVLFLAPTKPLVEQHASFLRKNLLNDNVAVFTGEVGTGKRAKLWAETDIIVSTPQVIVNDILGSKIDLKDVKLVIFDEAHRATGDYAYVFIGQRCRELDPLALGMTASPGSRPERIVEVCENLNIEGVEIRSEYDNDVVPYVHDISVDWKRVDMPEEIKAISKKLREALNEQVKELRKFGFLAERRFVGTKDILMVGQEIRKKLHEGKSPSLFTAASTQAVAMKINHALEIAETQGPSALSSYFDRMEEESRSKGSSKASKRAVGNPKVIEAMNIAKHSRVEHPKLKLAVDVVSEQLRQKKDSRIIMFTHYRDTAELVTKEMMKIEGARPVKFVGQATRGRDKGLRQKEQVETIERFSEGEYNILVATSVAEEGLDIPSTDLVVFYEPIPSEIRTIQRRGRTGRKRAGKVVILITKDSRDEAYYWSSKRKENKMHQELEDLRSRLRDKLVVGMPSGEAFRAALSAGESSDVVKVEKGQKVLTDFEAGEDEKKTEVVVDTRELGSKVVKEMYAEGISVTTRRLEVADFILSERVAVERKEVGDFIKSIIDGRLFQQVISMKREYQSPVLIIEGEGLFQKTAMHEKAIYGALASLVADFNLPLIFTKDETETAHVLTAIAKREHKEGRKILGIRGEKGGMNLQERQRFIVESLPNISGTIANRLLCTSGRSRTS
jgi:Fanconi anemia group M protein